MKTNKQIHLFSFWENLWHDNLLTVISLYTFIYHLAASTYYLTYFLPSRVLAYKYEKQKSFFSGVFSVWNTILSAKGRLPQSSRDEFGPTPNCWKCLVLVWYLPMIHNSWVIWHWFEAISKIFGSAIFEVIQVKEIRFRYQEPKPRFNFGIGIRIDFWSLDLLEAIQGITFQCKKNHRAIYSILVYFTMFSFHLNSYQYWIWTSLDMFKNHIIDLNMFRHVWGSYES